MIWRWFRQQRRSMPSNWRVFIVVFLASMSFVGRLISCLVLLVVRVMARPLNCIVWMMIQSIFWSLCVCLISADHRPITISWHPIAIRQHLIAESDQMSVRWVLATWLTNFVMLFLEILLENVANWQATRTADAVHHHAQWSSASSSPSSMIVVVIMVICNGGCHHCLYLQWLCCHCHHLCNDCCCHSSHQSQWLASSSLSFAMIVIVIVAVVISSMFANVALCQCDNCWCLDIVCGVQTRQMLDFVFVLNITSWQSHQSFVDVASLNQLINCIAGAEHLVLPRAKEELSVPKRHLAWIHHSFWLHNTWVAFGQQQTETFCQLSECSFGEMNHCCTHCVNAELLHDPMHTGQDNLSCVKF